MCEYSCVRTYSRNMLICRYKAHSFRRCVLIFVFDGRRCHYKKRNEESERKRQEAILARDAARTYADMEKALKQLVCIDSDVLYWVKRWATARKLNNSV